MIETQTKSKRTWMVLVGCCLAVAVGWGTSTTVIGLFIVPISATLNCDIATTSLFFTFCTFFSIVPMTVVPRLMTRIPLRVFIGAAGAILGCTNIILATFPSVPIVFVCGCLTGLTAVTCSILSVPMIIAKWFRKNQGTFIGIALSCSGVGSAILSPIATALIVSMGWQFALRGLAVLEIVVIVLCAVFLIRDNPESMGLLPYGAEQTRVESDKPQVTAELPGATFKQIFKTPAFPLLVIVLAIMGYASSLMPQIGTISQVSGYSPAVGGVAASICSVSIIIGKIASGRISDKFGGGVLGAVIAAVFVAGFGLIIASMLTGNVALLYLSCVLIGMGCSSGTMGAPLYTKDAYGLKEYDKIYGLMMIFQQAGSAFSAPSLAAIQGAAGSYLYGFILLIVLAVIMVPSGFLAVKFGRKLWAE